jgi:hypothetical protein
MNCGVKEINFILDSLDNRFNLATGAMWSVFVLFWSRPPHSFANSALIVNKKIIQTVSRKSLFYIMPASYTRVVRKAHIKVQYPSTQLAKDQWQVSSSLCTSYEFLKINLACDKLTFLSLHQVLLVSQSSMMRY